MSEENDYLKVLENQINFQRYWKNLTLSCYVSISIGAILCTSATSILAALNFSTQAAVLAGIATIFIALETTFSFKEKWSHHLNILTELLNIKLELQLRNHTKEEIIEKIMKAQTRYASELPVRDK